MTIHDDYLETRTPPIPSPARVFFDQQVIPVAIDAAGNIERGLDRVAEGSRREPWVAMAAGVMGGALLALMHRRER